MNDIITLEGWGNTRQAALSEVVRVMADWTSETTTPHDKNKAVYHVGRVFDAGFGEQVWYKATAVIPVRFD